MGLRRLRSEFLLGLGVPEGLLLGEAFFGEGFFGEGFFGELVCAVVVLGSALPGEKPRAIELTGVSLSVGVGSSSALHALSKLCARVCAGGGVRNTAGSKPLGLLRRSGFGFCFVPGFGFPSVSGFGFSFVSGFGSGLGSGCEGSQRFPAA